MEKNIKLENELKAIQLQSEDCCQMWIHGCPNVKYGAMKMAEWKDKQMLDFLRELTFHSNLSIVWEKIYNKITELSYE
jgi:hypothetical protein